MRHPHSPDKKGGAFPTSTAGQTVVLYDSKTTGQGRPAAAPSDVCIITAFQLDQAVTYIHKWAPERDAADSALVIINGAAQAGEVAAANTFFRRKAVLNPGRDQISVLMGTPAPTANFIAVDKQTSDATDTV